MRRTVSSGAGLPATKRVTIAGLGSHFYEICIPGLRASFVPHVDRGIRSFPRRRRDDPSFTPAGAHFLLDPSV
jgi:hypothetical protein